MAGFRSNSDIIKGSALMLFFNDNGTDTPIGFATEHSIEINLETTDISTKDHGDFAAVLPQRLTWSGSASNLYSDEGEAFYMSLVTSMTPVKVKFAKASEYLGYDETEVVGSETYRAERGIVGDTGRSANWTAGDVVAEGEALVNNFSINASAGDNATMTIQLQGVGSLVFGSSSSPTGVTGTTGPANH